MLVKRINGKFWLHDPKNPANDRLLENFEEGRKLVYESQNLELGDYYEAIVDIDGNYIPESIRTNERARAFEKNHGKDRRKHFSEKFQQVHDIKKKIKRKPGNEGEGNSSQAANF